MWNCCQGAAFDSRSRAIKTCPLQGFRHTLTSLQSLAYKCWRKDPKLRPSFAEITAHLGQVRRDAAWRAAGDSQENMNKKLSQSLESMCLDRYSQQAGAQPAPGGGEEGGARAHEK